jgi:hypothetical protein
MAVATPAAASGTPSVLFTPILGAVSEGPLCYLLEIDDVTLLLDCGWNEHFDVELLEGLERCVFVEWVRPGVLRLLRREVEPHLCCPLLVYLLLAASSIEWMPF